MTPTLHTIGSTKFLRIPRFLPEEVRNDLFHTACANQEMFQPRQAPGIEASETSHWPTLMEGVLDRSGPIGDAIGVLGDHIKRILPIIFESLGTVPFSIEQVPLELIHGLNGHSCCPHQDSSDGVYQVSLLYYFHKIPKAFCGGDLEIFESDQNAMEGYKRDPVTTVTHEDNLLLAFPSETFHGVTEVQCNSTEFADGRFTAVGFLGRN